MSLKEWLEGYENLALYADGFENGYKYNENVLIKPDACLFIPARVNLEATIESERKIKIREYATTSSLLAEDRDVPSLFWSENLIYSDKNIYVFQTNYYKNDAEILPISYLDKIPKKLTKNFLRKVPQEILELANKLIGTEKNITNILNKFYEFTMEHEKYKSPTSGKSIEKLLSEYKKDGYFYGTCKEARDFFSALCNSQGLPTKKVVGKSLSPCAHVWVDVIIPTNNGYKLFPVDAALKFFGELQPLDHLFYEYAPLLNLNIFNEISDTFKKEDYKYKLKIKRKK